jgi:hypothetical protein
MSKGQDEDTMFSAPRKGNGEDGSVWSGKRIQKIQYNERCASTKTVAVDVCSGQRVNSQGSESKV